MVCYGISGVVNRETSESRLRLSVVPRDQVCSLFFVYKSLFLPGGKLYDVMFIHQIYFGPFLSAHFLT